MGGAEPGAEGAGRAVVLVKLGGSLITDKRRPHTARGGVIRRLAGELAEALPVMEGALLLGHGSGSFGHAEAARGAGAGAWTAEHRTALSRTQRAAASLHGVVVDALLEAGLLPFSVAPSAAAVARRGRLEGWPVAPVVAALELGMVPVVYGDVVLDSSRGATVVSTERVLAAVAERLPDAGWRPVRAVWAGDVAGVLDASGRPLERVGAEAGEALEVAGPAAAPDVTGGMEHRLRVALRLAERGIPSWIGSGREAGRLCEVLVGRQVPGTRVEAGGPTPERGK